jgi:hypothetical protein
MNLPFVYVHAYMVYSESSWTRFIKSVFYILSGTLLCCVATSEAWLLFLLLRVLHSNEL